MVADLRVAHQRSLELGRLSSTCGSRRTSTSPRIGAGPWTTSTRTRPSLKRLARTIRCAPGGGGAPTRSRMRSSRFARAGGSSGLGPRKTRQPFRAVTAPLRTLNRIRREARRPARYPRGHSRRRRASLGLTSSPMGLTSAPLGCDVRCAAGTHVRAARSTIPPGPPARCRIRLLGDDRLLRPRPLLLPAAARASRHATRWSPQSHRSTLSWRSLRSLARHSLGPPHHASPAVCCTRLAQSLHIGSRQRFFFSMTRSRSPTTAWAGCQATPDPKTAGTTASRTPSPVRYGSPRRR